jgi:release factor glutamine methyltransferase
VGLPPDVEGLTDLLWQAGFVAADEEAAELLGCAGGDAEVLDALVARRLTGEPLAWITGTVTFCDVAVRVAPGVYVPRWHSEPLARRAASLLPPGGVAVDLCTGTGAVARVLREARPSARVVGTDIDERAVACARSNGVEAHLGDLFAPVLGELRGRVDVVVGIVPYVPTAGLEYLQRDTLTFESSRSYDGGPDGMALVRRAVHDAGAFLRPRGTLLLELGADQPDLLAGDLAAAGYGPVRVLADEDGDVRGIEATLLPRE